MTILSSALRKCRFVSFNLTIDNPEHVPKLSFCCRPEVDFHARLVGRWKLLGELLGLTKLEGKYIFFKNVDVRAMDPLKLQHTVTVLKNLNISGKGVLEYPELLSRVPFSIEEQYKSLVELGLHPVGAPELVRYEYLMVQTPAILRRWKLLDVNKNPVDNLHCILNDVGTMSIVRERSSLMNASLKYIRRLFLVQLLRSKLKCSDAEANIILRRNAAIARHSLEHLRNVINVLIEEFDFSVDMIKEKRFLLSSNLENIRKIRDSLMATFGTKGDLNAFLHCYPKILTSQAEHVADVNACLQEFGICEEQIARCGHVFMLNSQTVRKRLEKIFSSLAVSPEASAKPSSLLNILPTVYNFPSTWPCYSEDDIDLDSTPDQSADKDHRQCRHRRLLGSDNSVRNCIIFLVAKRLGCSQEEIKLRLLVRYRSPQSVWHLMDLHRTGTVLNLLLERGFSVVQILNALQLVLHDPASVERQLDLLTASEHLPLFGDWRSHPFILQLLLYYMQKDAIIKDNESKAGSKAVKVSKTI